MPSANYRVLSVGCGTSSSVAASVTAGRGGGVQAAVTVGVSGDCDWGDVRGAVIGRPVELATGGKTGGDGTDGTRHRRLLEMSGETSAGVNTVCLVFA